jgi:hypothetical protein
MAVIPDSPDCTIYTAAHRWIKRKSIELYIRNISLLITPWKIYDIPEHMKYDPVIKSGNIEETLPMLWIQYFKTEPPAWMQHSPEISNKYMTCAMYYIEHVSRTIMIFKRDQLKGLSDLPFEPSAWMRHAPELKNSTGYTMAMLWLLYVNGEVPSWMQHAPEIQGPTKRTCAMYYITNYKKSPPEWMHHDKNIRDISGHNCMDLWYIYTSPRIDGGRNYTSIHEYSRGDVILCEKPPEWMGEYEIERPIAYAVCEHGDFKYVCCKKLLCESCISDKSEKKKRIFYEEECMICKEPYDKNEIMIFNCGHMMCSQCYEIYNLSCPFKCKSD